MHSGKPCKGMTNRGRPCRQAAMRDGDYCFVHRPEFKSSDIGSRRRRRQSVEKAARREKVVELYERDLTAKQIAAELGVSEGTARWDCVCLRKQGRIGYRYTPVDSYVDDGLAREITAAWNSERVPIRVLADRYGWSRIQTWGVVQRLRAKGFDLPARTGELEVGADEKRSVKRSFKKRILPNDGEVVVSEATKPILRVLGVARRPLGAVEVHRFLLICGFQLSKQAVRNRLKKAVEGGFAQRVNPDERCWFERGAGRWFIPFGSEQSAESLTLADAERETELAALIETQEDELKRGDWIDSEKGHWADKSIDAPLTADGFTILDTLGDEDEALAELVGEAT
jgi:hypothetical protein